MWPSGIRCGFERRQIRRRCWCAPTGRAVNVVFGGCRPRVRWTPGTNLSRRQPASGSPHMGVLCRARVKSPVRTPYNVARSSET
jgi:hypothetical protein